MWFLILFACFIWLIGTLYLSFVLYYRLTRQEVYVPFIPADAKGIDSMCEAIKLSGSKKIIDVGSGWGTILFYLDNKYKNLNLTGIELHPVLYWIAKLRKRLFHKSSSIKLLKGDAAKLSYKNFDIVFLFMLSPFVNKVMVPKFEKELRKGAKVVSYVFRMKSKLFKETQIKLPAHNWKSAVYIYEKII